MHLFLFLVCLLKLTKADRTYNTLLPCIKDNPLLSLDFVKAMDAWALPVDAESHYRELLKKTEKFRNHPSHEVHGFKGPWIENKWIERNIGKPLSSFNGLIPLFVQFVDIHANGFLGKGIDHGYYKRLFESMGEEIADMLRKDVLYVTVSQDDEGIAYKDRAGLFQIRPNILVFSAGGYGHIPIPLIKNALQYVEPPVTYKWDVGFYGAPGQNITRRALLDEAIDEIKAATTFSINMAQNPAWKKNMLDTKFNLAPRGFGRTSYRLAELVQMGKLPVYLYSDAAWLPYQGTEYSVAVFGISSKRGQGKHLARKLLTIHNNNNEHAPLSSVGSPGSSTTSSGNGSHASGKNGDSAVEIGFAARLKMVREAAPYYTLEGVLAQIELFLKDPLGPNGGYLRCERVPSTVI